MARSVAVGPSKTQIQPFGTRRLSPCEMSQDVQGSGASGWGVAIRSVEMRRRAAAAGPEALSSELPLRRACWTLRKGAPGSCCFSSDRQRIAGARAPAGGSGWAGVRTRRPVDDSLPPAGAPPGGARARRPAVLCQVNREALPAWPGLQAGCTGLRAAEAPPAPASIPVRDRG